MNLHERWNNAIIPLQGYATTKLLTLYGKPVYRDRPGRWREGKLLKVPECRDGHGQWKQG